jgi:predicted phage terminase large subunit-like protein
MAERHTRLWEWFCSLGSGNAIDPRIEVWPRGGAKSTTVELAVTYIGWMLFRRYVLYVSGTQEQADKHVGSIAAFFERVGVDRALTKYGNSKGWRRNQLRCANGFNVEALGLDTAARGIKLDEFRPDLLIFDDIDDEADTSKAVDKKIRAITRTIIPAGTENVAVLGVQNLVHEDGVFSRLVDGRADFLHHRDVPPVEVAIEGLEVEPYIDPKTNKKLYRITAGTPTWEGQSIRVCEAQINSQGLQAFRRESQHEVRGAAGYFFDETAFRYCKPSEIPTEKLRLCRAWDLAATQGGGDWTVGVLMGITPAKVVYILDVQRYRFEPNGVRALIRRTAERDDLGIVYAPDEVDSARGKVCALGKEVFRFVGRTTVHMPQDPSQAGKDQAGQYRELLAAHAPTVESVSGKKAKRAEGYADQVNGGNVILVEGEWNHAFTEEHRKFRADEDHEFDDQVDAAADAFNELAGRRQIQAT